MTFCQRKQRHIISIVNQLSGKASFQSILSVPWNAQKNYQIGSFYYFCSNEHVARIWKYNKEVECRQKNGEGCNDQSFLLVNRGLLSSTCTKVERAKSDLFIFKRGVKFAFFIPGPPFMLISLQFISFIQARAQYFCYSGEKFFFRP